MSWTDKYGSWSSSEAQNLLVVHMQDHLKAAAWSTYNKKAIENPLQIKLIGALACQDIYNVLNYANASSSLKRVKIHISNNVNML